MIAYFDCFSGISGDMTLGAFMDLGVPKDYIEKNIKNMPLENFVLHNEKTLKNGINASSCFVEIKKNAKHLNYQEIKKVIKTSILKENIKKMSLAIFEEIANAEAHIHNIEKEKIHFHELSSIDTIVDIVGTSLCIDYLKIKKSYASALPFGKGFVNCTHGRLPLPTPATAHILKNCPVYDAKIKGELITPTGAAIIKTLATDFGTMPDMKVKNIGYGAGDNNFGKTPNLLRVIIGEETKTNYDIIIIETCIDDISPEILGWLMEHLFENGAIDVYFIPIFMKKNRPATKIEVLCKKEKIDILSNIILSETSSIGLRYFNAKRKMLERKEILIDTKFGKMKFKSIKRPNGKNEIIPEFEECKRVAKKEKIPLKDVMGAFVRTK